MKAKLIREMDAVEGVTPSEWITTKADGTQVCPVGLVFEHPQAFYQVLMGNAEPADEECVLKVRKQRTPQQLQEAIEASNELHAKIHTDGSMTDIEEEVDLLEGLDDEIGGFDPDEDED